MSAPLVDVLQKTRHFTDYPKVPLLAIAWYGFYQALGILLFPRNMKRRRKNPHAVALGRLGGKVSSAAKKRAARRNVLKRWAREKEEDK
jgi:hypothetical protein